MALPTRARAALAFAALVAGYVAAGKLGLSLAVIHPSASAVWPPTGIGIAAGVLLGLRPAGAGVFLGALLVNLSTTGDVPTSLAIAGGNALEAVAGAWLVGRLAGGRGAFEHARGVAGFTAAVLASTTLSATVGAVSLTLGGLSPVGAFGTVWLTWWLGDAMGGLVVAPALLTLAPGGLRPRRSLAEAAGLAGALVASAALVFGLAGLPGYPVSFAALPAMLWAAFRFGPAGAALASVLTMGMAVTGTLRGQGPFTRWDPNTALLLLQGFLGMATVTSLTVAALVAERVRVEADLRAARNQLEQRVVERTATLRQAYEALQNSEALLADAERIAGLGSWGWDMPGDQVRWSEQLYRIYGVDPGSFRATFAGFLQLVHPEDRARVEHAVRQAAETAQPFEFEHRIVRPDGEVRLMHARGHVVTDPAGRAVRMAGTGQDVTAQRRAAEAVEQLKELERLKDMDHFRTQFLNVAAHELSTPLTPLLLQLAILRDPAVGPLNEAQRHSVDILERNVERLAKLVQDTLEAARLQAHRLGVEPRPMDLAVAVAEAVEAFREPARRAGVAVEARLDGPVQVLADPARVHQVLMNLLGNAWKFTPAGGRVTVSCAAEDDAGVVRVADTGAGFSPGDGGKLFEPFAQLPEAASARTEGTGLGLYLCRGIVELHGGRMWAESPGPGQGATLGFTLPLAPASPRTGTAAGARAR